MASDEATEHDNQSEVISRREALKRTALGLTAATAAASGVNVASAAGLGAGSFNWKKFSGTTINAFFDSHPWQQAVQPLIPQFEQKTGIKVNVQVLPESQYYNRALLGLGAKPAQFDVFFQDLVDFGYKAWANGWLEPLDSYIKNKSITDPSTLAINDFFPKFLDGFRLPTSKSGKLYGIPITVETYVIFYRKDIFKQYKINVNSLKTVDDWLAAVRELAPKIKSHGMYGAVLRGANNQLIDQFDGLALDFWGNKPYIERRLNFFDAKWHPQFTRPAVVKALKTWAEVEKLGPPGITSYDWNSASTQFAQGRAATFWFDASLFAAIFEDPKQSRVVGKTGYAMIPAGAKGQSPKTAFWNWGLGIPKNAKNKDAAWYFIQWATSKAMEQNTALKTFAPVRKSTWTNPKIVKKFPAGFANAVSYALQHADDADILFSGADQVGIKIGDATAKIYGGMSPEAAAKWLNTEATKIVKSAGLLKS
jgi:multiple sugar transport system substrate-binding protein